MTAADVSALLQEMTVDALYVAGLVLLAVVSVYALKFILKGITMP